MKRFGTLEGVFIPSLLSIFGVIMYLRLGWVVGQVGIIAALAIILLSNFISLATGLSVSSIVTNIRIGHGGAYSIITKSLGIEAGGAIGIPLYLSQAISVAFYIVGFGLTWVYVFPQHSFLAVCLIAWIGVLFVSYYSAQLAFRLQYGVLAIIALSLVSMFLGGGSGRVLEVDIPTFSTVSFFKAFAVFFPAVTGFMAGVSMSGELNEPKKSIPQGTLMAIGTSLVVYVALAFWFYKSAPAALLVSNDTIAIDLGKWPMLVVAGIMGATLSSALNMCVTAPRTLFALSKSTILPAFKPFIHLNKKQEPTTAILLTALIALVTILMGTLDKVAGLLTMFFLITYGLINFSVFIEQMIGIPSFRPSLRIPRILSFLGGVGSFAVMFLIDPVFGFVAFLVIIFIYIGLLRRGSKFYSPDIRSGLLIFLSEQMAKAAASLPYYPKIWKPNVIAPVRDFESFSKSVSIIQDLVRPSGRLTVFYVTEKKKKDVCEEFKQAVDSLKEEGIFSESFAVEADNIPLAQRIVLQAMKGTHFPPNTLFLTLSENETGDKEALSLVKKATEENIGIVALLGAQKKNLPESGAINLWIRQGSPNIDLSILSAIQLQKNWEGSIRLLQIVDVPEAKDQAIAFLSRLSDLMRLPSEVGIEIIVGKFPQAFEKAPAADINILGMQENPDLTLFRKIAGYLQTPLLILRDSPHESAIA